MVVKGKNQGLLIMVVVWIVLLAADVITTLRLGELIPYLEANPVFKHAGFIGIIVFNLVVLWLFWWAYSRSANPHVRFVILLGMVFVCVTRVFIIVNNWLVGNSPPSIEEARAVTREVKTAYLLAMVVPQVVPYFMGWLAFLVFGLDHKVEVRRWNE